MRRMSALHCSLVVLAVGLLATAFPVVALGCNIGPVGP
jgi:hypothetical protein